MSEFSVDTDDLALFVDAGGRFVESLQTVLGQLDLRQSMVVAAIGSEAAPPSSNRTFEDLIGRVLQTNRFVGAIVEAFEGGGGLAGPDSPAVGLLALFSDGGLPGEQYAAAIEDFATERDLSFEEAEELWVDIHARIFTLIDVGYSADDAQAAVLAADHYGLDLDAIETLAADEGVGLVDATGLQLRADHYAMTVPEVMAYDGLNEHFDTFDNAKGGDTDGKVSLEDLQHVVDRPDRFSADEVAAAAALLASPELLSRLDTGRENNDVLNDGDRFGDDDFDDRKVSLEDVENFEWKQGVNALVGVHYDQIDVVNGGSADHHLSKADFETYLDRHRTDLTAEEIQALEVVIDGELYDKGWLERNKRSLAIAAAVVAGAAIAISTGGIGSGISGALITAAVTGTGGAAAAGATTFAINGFSDESEWDDDLLANTGHGFLAGMAGGGLGVAGPTWGATSGVGRFAVASGVASDGAAIVGMGGADWAIDTIPGVDHEDLDGLHDVANGASLAFGVTGLTAAGFQGAANLYRRNMAAGTAAALPESVVNDVETFATQGVPESQALSWLTEHPDGIAMMDAAIDAHVAGLGDDVVSGPLAATDWDHADEVRRRLVGQLASGVEPPVVRETTESLYKLVPAGQDVSQYSPFWMTRQELDNLLGSRRDLADALGLPYVSHADEYRVWRIDLIGEEPVSVFASEIAPTTELYGMVSTTGGSEQVLVPNRSLYHEAVIDIAEPIVNRANGGLIAPAREAGAVAQTAIDDAVARPLVADDLTIDHEGFSPPLVLEEFSYAGA